MDSFDQYSKKQEFKIHLTKLHKTFVRENECIVRYLQKLFENIHYKKC